MACGWFWLSVSWQESLPWALKSPLDWESLSRVQWYNSTVQQGKWSRRSVLICTWRVEASIYLFVYPPTCLFTIYPSICLILSCPFLSFPLLSACPILSYPSYEHGGHILTCICFTFTLLYYIYIYICVWRRIDM